MKKSQPWHDTRFGAIARFLGSIQLAVPILILVAIAMAWGTYLESTAGTKTARALVYGSWWFIGVMVLVSVSLVFAVITRYPWKRRHVGFITVHASLITMIIGGFWSLFGRVEGNLPLQEGTSGSAIETDQERLELVAHQDGQFLTIEEAAVAERVVLNLDGVPIQIVERWVNTTEEHYVADDGPDAFRAVEVSFDPASGSEWVGEEAKAGGVSTVRGLRIRLLADGAEWQPPATSEPLQPGFYFQVGEARFPLADEGRDGIPGWKVVSIRRFTRALVSGAGLTESESGPENPAVDVTLADGQGTTERHTAFLNFPDMVMNKTLEGSAKSGAKLTATPASGALETLVIYGPAAASKAAYVPADGVSRTFGAPGSYPWTIDAGARKLTILRQFTRARQASRFVKAPAAKEHRPALVLRVGDATELTVAAWKDITPVAFGSRSLMLRYRPEQVPLPFTVTLKDFRKMDYPGTEMAMAYESDVGVTLDGQPEQPYRIYMNNPYAHGAWRVYQSGFMGERISIFSVMRDPGLPLTYIGCAGLCVGIVLTFYSRSLSWGHPGIPIEFASTKEPASAPTPHLAASPSDALPVDQPVGASV